MGYSVIIRALPEMLIILVLFYGVGQFLGQLFEARWLASSFVAGTISLGLISGAHIGELFRGAWLALPPGQLEAARSLGLGRLPMGLYVVGPQVVGLMLAGLGNIWLQLLKDTALVSLVGLNELMRVSTTAAHSSQEPILFYTTAAGLYLLLTVLSSRLGDLWSRKRGD